MIVAVLVHSHLPLCAACCTSHRVIPYVVGSDLVSTMWNLLPKVGLVKPQNLM